MLVGLNARVMQYQGEIILLADVQSGELGS